MLHEVIKALLNIFIQSVIVFTPMILEYEIKIQIYNS